MTYCVGLRLDRGIVFASDTRTNAGFDNVATFSKMHVWERKGDRVLLMGPRPGRVLESHAVALPRPRWDYDVRAHPEFVALRGLLWERIRAMVIDDPESDFFRRG